MSNNYIISACSYADMPVARMKEIDVKYICTPYMVNGEIFYDDLGETTDYEKFYQSMRDGAVTNTFQLNQDDFADYFRELLKNGQDIIHVSLSSGLSGVSNSARLAIETMKEEFPDRTIYLIDSLAASAGYGLLLQAMSDKRKEGMNIIDLYNWVEENKLKLHH